MKTTVALISALTVSSLGTIGGIFVHQDLSRANGEILRDKMVCSQERVLRSELSDYGLELTREYCNK